MVLLGETHDEVEHHRWQLHTIAALQLSGLTSCSGFEMFPRRVQPVLDRWVKGELNEAEFPARGRLGGGVGIRRRALSAAVPFRPHASRADAGAQRRPRDHAANRATAALSGVPIAEREGVGDPAPASAAYRNRLFEVFKQHPAGSTGAGPESALFQRFVAAQLLWDRAMAEAIAAAGRDKEPLIVGIMGQGHIEYRDGVVHQLAALGVDDVASALPWPVDADCRKPDARVADFVFGVAPPKQVRVPPPRLGVVLSVAEGGVRVDQVLPNSIAETTGLQVGDVIENAAGVSVRRPADLVTVVRRQAPGTWLPLSVRRGEQSSEMVARFPAER